MDRNITVRFYQIETSGDDGASFADSFREAYRLPLADRERNVSDGLRLRLEQLDERDGFLTGDITRVQTENLPSYPTHNSTDPLPIDRLGHHTAFCFDPVTQIVAIQFDVKMAMGRLCSYGSAFSKGKHFQHLPVLQAEALERFESETPTKFRVRVAKVNKFADFNETITDFERGFEQMGALFDAPVVDITVSCRGRDGGLNRDSVSQTIRRLLDMRDSFSGITSITAETDEASYPYNFVQDLLKISNKLDIPANDPNAARGIRIDFTRQCINEQLSYLRSAYGPRNDT